LHQFVAGEEHADAHTTIDRQFRQAGRGGEGDFLRAELDTRGQDFGAGRDVFAGPADVLAQFRDMIDHHAALAMLTAFLHDHGIGSGGNRRAGEDAGGAPRL